MKEGLVKFADLEGYKRELDVRGTTWALAWAPNGSAWAPFRRR